MKKYFWFGVLLGVFFWVAFSLFIVCLIVGTVC